MQRKFTPPIKLIYTYMRGISIGFCRGVLGRGEVRLLGNIHSAAAYHFRDVWGHDPSGTFGVAI